MGSEMCIRDSSRPLGIDDEAKDQEELQVQVDQGALPRHLLLQVRLGEQQDGQRHPQESPLNSSDQLLRLGGDIYVVVRQNLPNHRSNINCNMTNVCPLSTPHGVSLYLGEAFHYRLKVRVSWDVFTGKRCPKPWIEHAARS